MLRTKENQVINNNNEVVRLHRDAPSEHCQRHSPSWSAASLSCCHEADGTETSKLKQIGWKTAPVPMQRMCSTLLPAFIVWFRLFLNGFFLWWTNYTSKDKEKKKTIKTFRFRFWCDMHCKIHAIRGGGGGQCEICDMPKMPRETLAPADGSPPEEPSVHHKAWVLHKACCYVTRRQLNKCYES